ncbi:hypothetical protein BKA67DRAFT_552618 [Truncatella angustata]|uniref:Uncharacterized protein n=1 Tax=Truncatella angustata TaxID=152316 RepID=A0A9P8UR97_9PEZI|nr:uncharacterized protein BKA67DRAFT_552618 [Truncatella angustata]KAH6656662.1 hypothetical protein BKA67DRAFT_552618 [Truncatella angustata]KAH8199284.1 hypothetical protein TruAng_006567 [Truncatella angustata]
MASNGMVVIDLTLDEDIDQISIQNTHHSTLRAPDDILKPAVLLKQEQQLRNSRLRPPLLNTQKPSASRVHQPERRLVTSPNGFREPLAKRQRTNPPVETPNTAALEKQTHSYLNEQFYSYLRQKLMPKISEIIQQLKASCNNEHERKLHYTVFDKLVKSCEQEWKRCLGQLSQAFESELHAYARKLVLQLKDDPKQLMLPPARRQLRPVIISTEQSSPASDIGTDTGAGTGTGTGIGEAAPIQHGRAVSEDEEEVDDIQAVVSHEESTEDTKQTESSKLTNNEPLVPRSRLPEKASPVSPQRLRARAIAKQWQSGKAVQEEVHSANTNGWFRLSTRPYLPWYKRRHILGRDHQLQLEDSELQQPSIIHVDFSKSEVDYLQYVARELFGSKIQVRRNNVDDLRHLLKKAKKMNSRQDILKAHENNYHSFKAPPAALLTRSTEDLDSYMTDLHNRKLRPGVPQVFTAWREEVEQNSTVPVSRASSLLLAREIAGNRAFGSLRYYDNFATTFRTSHEDCLEPRIEWTNCAGDIMTLTWISDTGFVCGTTTHSDSHNQQYNKPGNLLLGSAKGTLQALPHHRIPRPIVANGENALDSMVESQDPWLFTSVVDSDYDPVQKRAYTASFDNRVLVWKIEEDNTMKALDAWEHSGRVNFVLASKHPSGLVATAADVHTDAVRVYHRSGHYDTYSCTKIHDQEYVPSEKWAYCPAAIRWGSAPDTYHLLLIGYSPRSLSGDERDVPEDKWHTGELCLWDTLKKVQIKVNSVATQNVFEVVWHPSKNSFAVATSKATSLERADNNVKTQIRIFELNEDKQYGAIKTLDCPAIDINELILRPNSLVYSYVAAGCTDGNVYIWDTAGSDLPMCVLQHGEPVEEFLGEKEEEDVGVKFVAWGTTADRLYTGSSDGVVKVWNIRHGKSVHLRDLIEVPGPITAGAFSPDHTKLVIGDGSGRVYLLSVDDAEEDKPSANSSGVVKMQVQGKQKAIRRPRLFMPHPEVPPLDGYSKSSLGVGQEKARGFLHRGEIILHPHQCIGAIQGPNYANTQMFRSEAHLYGEGGQPLLAQFERYQQENTRFPSSRGISRLQDFTEVGPRSNGMIGAQDRRAQRQGKEFDDDTRAALEAERAEIDSDYDFEYESSYDDASGEDEMV